jgi:hypothetical protein
VARGTIDAINVSEGVGWLLQTEGWSRLTAVAVLVIRQFEFALSSRIAACWCSSTRNGCCHVPGPLLATADSSKQEGDSSRMRVCASLYSCPLRQMQSTHTCYRIVQAMGTTAKYEANAIHYSTVQLVAQALGLGAVPGLGMTLIKELCLVTSCIDTQFMHLIINGCPDSCNAAIRQAWDQRQCCSSWYC